MHAVLESKACLTQIRLTHFFHRLPNTPIKQTICTSAVLVAAASLLHRRLYHLSALTHYQHSLAAIERQHIVGEQAAAGIQRVVQLAIEFG